MAFADTLYGGIYGEWRTIAVLAAAGSVLVSIMLIMLARLFDMKSLEQNAKSEFVYAASTVFIVLFAIGLIGFGDTVVTPIAKEMYVNSITSCPPDQALIVGSPCYKLRQLRSSMLSGAGVLSTNVETLPDLMLLYMEGPATCSQQFLNYLYIAAIPVDACTSLYMEVYMSEQLTCYGLKWVSERITNAVQGLTFYMFVYYMLAHSMLFVKFYAGFFFSIGVALRAFPPTRGGGAYLMALSVGLYFVLPFAYVMITTMALPYAQSGFVTATSGAGNSIQYSCNTPAVGDVSWMGCGAGTFAQQKELMGWLKANKSRLLDFVTFNVSSVIRHLTSVICVFPFVAFSIFFTFVLNTTNLFGGNIPEIGRGLVRLI